MSMRLENKVAWVSGASSGMGEAITRLFAQEGASVAMIDVQREKGEKIAADIRASGGKATFIECDVRKEQPVRESIDRTVHELGGLQILVNCAGIVQVKQLHELEVAE